MPKEKLIEEDKVMTPQDQAASFLKANKSDHYNFEKTHDYKVPFSSLLLTEEIGGGLCPGCHRFTGINSGGKSSAADDAMFNFLKTKNRRGVLFKCEGRHSKEMQARSGVKFVFKPEEWLDGTCLVVESNIYEAVFGFTREMITNNPLETEYLFIYDSVDGMIKRDDADKPLEIAGQVAGGALITSVFLKKVGIALAKRGHIAIFISQIREEIKINVYEKTTPRQGKASGGRSLEHQADIVLDFQPRTQEDLIRETPGDKATKIIGHYCKVQILKSNNEKNLTIIKYPIKYWRTGGKSVWIEQEIVDVLLKWNLLEKKGAWFKINENLIKEFSANKIEDVEIQHQGLDNFRKYIEGRPEIITYLFNKFVNLFQ